MHPPRSTIGSLLFIVAAFSVGLAALKEKDVKGVGLSMLMIIGLVGATFGACSDAGAGRTSSEYVSGLLKRHVPDHLGGQAEPVEDQPREPETPAV
jgi:uncharacterized membrane protein YeaQ/YmgE (transglycosylase-associated protein family)